MKSDPTLIFYAAKALLLLAAFGKAVAQEYLRTRGVTEQEASIILKGN